MALNVLIFGSTGMVGYGVLHECLKHPEIEKVSAINRRSVNVEHPKFKEIIHSDFLDYTSLGDDLRNFDACFYCLGVSQTQVRGDDEYTKITYDFALAAANALLPHNPEMIFCFLSGAGTNAEGKQLWARVKGETENALNAMPFKSLYHFRPAYIHPRHGQKHSLWFARIFHPLYPVLNGLFPKAVTTTEEFGLAMINTVRFGYPSQILENSDIRKQGTLTPLDVSS